MRESSFALLILALSRSILIWSLMSHIICLLTAILGKDEALFLTESVALYVTGGYFNSENRSEGTNLVIPAALSGESIIVSSALDCLK